MDVDKILCVLGGFAIGWGMRGLITLFLFGIRKTNER
jgi:hypothetical protein